MIEGLGELTPLGLSKRVVWATANSMAREICFGVTAGEDDIQRIAEVGYDRLYTRLGPKLVSLIERVGYPEARSILEPADFEFDPTESDGFLHKAEASASKFVGSPISKEVLMELGIEAPNQIPMTRYMLPNGERDHGKFIVRDPELAKRAMVLVEQGIVFEVETLTTGHLSLTSTREDLDFDIAIDVRENNTEGGQKAFEEVVTATEEWLKKSYEEGLKAIQEFGKAGPTYDDEQVQMIVDNMTPEQRETYRRLSKEKEASDGEANKA